MGFKLKYFYSGKCPYFTLDGNITNKEIINVFETLEKLLDDKKQFVFILDGRKVKEFPTMFTGYNLLNWLIKNYAKIPNKLLASTIIINNKTIIDMLEWVFKQKPPNSPNKITSDFDEGLSFVENYLPTYEDEIKNQEM